VVLTSWWERFACTTVNERIVNEGIFPSRSPIVVRARAGRRGKVSGKLR